MEERGTKSNLFSPLKFDIQNGDDLVKVINFTSHYNECNDPLVLNFNIFSLINLSLREVKRITKDLDKLLEQEQTPRSIHIILDNPIADPNSPIYWNCEKIIDVFLTTLSACALIAYKIILTINRNFTDTYLEILEDSLAHPGLVNTTKSVNSLDPLVGILGNFLCEDLTLAINFENISLKNIERLLLTSVNCRAEHVRIKFYANKSKLHNDLLTQKLDQCLDMTISNFKNGNCPIGLKVDFDHTLLPSNDKKIQLLEKVSLLNNYNQCQFAYNTLQFFLATQDLMPKEVRGNIIYLWALLLIYKNHDLNGVECSIKPFISATAKNVTVRNLASQGFFATTDTKGPAKLQSAYINILKKEIEQSLMLSPGSITMIDFKGDKMFITLSSKDEITQFPGGRFSSIADKNYILTGPGISNFIAKHCITLLPASIYDAFPAFEESKDDCVIEFLPNTKSMPNNFFSI